MRSLAVLCVACVLAGCGPDRAPRGQPQAASAPTANAPPARRASIDPDLGFLLDASAGDFHAHQPPYPERFRDVRVGHTVDPDGKQRPLLRGQFLPKQGQVEPEWTTFVTIKTSDYEQMLGGQAEGFCQRSSIAWDDREDLSSSLKSRLDSLR